MKTTDYRMIAFEGDLDDVTRKFNAWASGDDGIEIINVQFVPHTFDIYANRYAVIVFYKKEIYKVEKLTSGKCKPVVERPAPKESVKQSGQDTLKEISRELAVIADALSFGYCSRCQGPSRELRYNIRVLKEMLGLNDDTTTVEYAGDGNTTWRTETKEDKND